MLKKKIWANFQRIVEVFTQKMDPHSFGWLNPDPEGQKITNKSEEILRFKCLVNLKKIILVAILKVTDENGRIRNQIRIRQSEVRIPIRICTNMSRIRNTFL